jgi:3-oxoacyl-[acyl-carrier protein] reductase
MPYSRRTEQEAATMAAAGELMQGLRAVVIGGGGGGIGAAITVAIAAAGADVAIVDVDDARAKAATDSAVKYGHKAIPVVADIRDPDDIERMVAEARDALGGIDVLVTVVGGLMAWRAPFHRMHEVADDEWDFVFDVNLKYVYRVLKATLRVMIEQGTGGSVVSIGSDAGTAGHGSPNMAAYGAAKSGLAHLVTTIAAEYGPDGIRMNMVSPGPTETGATSALSAEHIAGMNAAIPAAVPRQARGYRQCGRVLCLAHVQAGHRSGSWRRRWREHPEPDARPVGHRQELRVARSVARPSVRPKSGRRLVGIVDVDVDVAAYVCVVRNDTAGSCPCSSVSRRQVAFSSLANATAGTPSILLTQAFSLESSQARRPHQHQPDAAGRRPAEPGVGHRPRRQGGRVVRRARPAGGQPAGTAPGLPRLHQPVQGLADQRPPDLDPVALGRRDALRRRQAAAAAGR